jgi:hypothetical protein
MKLAVECAVETAYVYVGSGLTAMRGDQEYSLVGDSDGKLAAVRIVAQIPQDEACGLDIKPGSGDVKVVFRLTYPPTRERILSAMQAVEGLLSFYCSGQLSRIRWDQPKVEFIPEDEAEKALAGSFHPSYEYRDERIGISREAWNGVVEAAQRLGHLIIPLSFYREASNEFRQGRYAGAFCNFYLVLEDLYGAGKTRNKDIEWQFKNCPEMRESVLWTMDNYLTKRDHAANVRRLCSEEHRQYTVDGLIELLVRVRGNLHHFSAKSSKRHGTPLNQEDFESIAFFAMGLACRAVTRRLVDTRRSG